MKKILFLNTTKLAVLSAMLLLAVFCTIGMSFTPAEEGENIGNPNDSTYVTGPRRSHWTTTTHGACGSETTYYHHKKDYARVEARIRVHNDDGNDITNDILQNTAATGKIKISFNNKSKDAKGHVEGGGIIDNTEDNYDETKQSTSFGTAVYLNWDCGIADNEEGSDQKPDPDIDKSHKLEVTLTATHWPNSDYIFAGWHLESDNSVLTNEKDTAYTGILTLGGGGDGYTKYYSGATDIPATYDTQNRDTVKYYALYKPAPPIEVSLIPSENGSYTYKIGKEDEIQVSEISTISVKGAFTLKATPDEKHKFFGWYELIDEDGEKKEKYFSYETTTTATFLKNTTISAKFIPKDWATYIVRSEPEVQYYDFQAAANAAEDPSTNKVFLPLVDGVVPEGNYTIPSGVTLLIPYEATYKNSTNEPEVTSGTTKPTKYRQLTLASGCVIDVEGAVCVNAKMTDNQHTNGATWGESGIINMSEGAKIVLKKNKSAKLYCWGAIVGTGEIVAESSSTVYEAFQSNHYPGGTFLLAKLSSLSNNKIFPMQIYCIPNIQAHLKICYGAEEKLASAYATAGVGLQKDIVFITKKGAESGLFKLADEESYVEKWYDRQNDKLCYNLYGGADMEGITIKIASLSNINSTSYVLPITHNMLIELHPLGEQESTVNITSDIALLPSSKVTVKKNVVVNINKALYVYDSEEWKKAYAFGVDNKSVIYNPSKTTSFDALVDAVLEVDGTIQVEGGFYTTQSAADICSNGSGKIKYINAVGTMPELMQMKQTSSTAGETEAITITPAQLHNDENRHSAPDNYTQTDKAGAGDEFWYVASLGKWVKNEFGPELDIVDADNTNKTLTINANGWASSGWPYTINGTEYGKDDKAGKEKYRQADRTLIIKYNGTAGASLPIAVLDEDSKPICRHIYKVPFVYTGTEDMSDMDKNSIVFVKSGTTLQTTDGAEAKEIYVAPGAELKVAGKLTVGKLVLRTTPWQSAVLTIENGGAIAEDGQVYYSRIAPNKSTITDLHGGTTTYNSARYYQFGLPLSCSISSVTMSNTGKFGESNTPYGNTWLLKSYNESKRAENGISSSGDNWEALESTGTITAGVGYEIFSNSNYYREFYFPVDLTTATTQVSVQYTGGTISAEHNGWNIITSPLTSRANVPIIDPATAIKVCWLQADGSYKQEQPTIIPPAIPFSYQASAGDKELNFSVSSTAAAPRKQSAAEALTETEWVHLDIFDAYGEGDETSLFVHPTRFEQTYKTGIDMAKQSLTAARPIIYSTHAYGDMAFAGIADSLLENGIDLVVYSPSAQELTFSLRENKFLNRLEYLWLADNETGERTDLLMDDYTCRANAGTTKGRFVLNGRFKAPQISTGITNTQTDYNIYAIGNNIAISGVEQGTPIYVFDAVGHMIYTTSATSDEVIVPAPCAGVYMLTIGGQTAKLVVNK